MVARQRRPDRQQKAGREPDRLDVELAADLVDLGRPFRLEPCAAAFLPGRLVEIVECEIFVPGRTHQFDARHRHPVLGQPGARVGAQRDLARLAVAHEHGGLVGIGDAQHALERHGVAAPGHLDRQQVRGRLADRVGAQDRIVEHGRGLDRHRLDADIECPRLARGRDPCLDQRQEFVKDAVLEPDRQRQQPVEPALDGWEILLQHAVGIEQFQAGAMLEIGEVGAGQLPRDEQVIPADERRLGVVAFEIIGRVEQILPPGLALAARQSAEAV